MTMLLIIVVVLVAAIVLFVSATRRHGHQIASLDDFRARWQKVDIQAFANLVDPSEDRYLRQRLQPGAYRQIRRARARAAWDYLGRVGQNAQLMVQAGQIIQRHNAGAEAERARKHVDTAIKLRTAVFVAQCSLAANIVFPAGEAGLARVLQLYSDAAHSFDNTLDPATANVTM